MAALAIGEAALLLAALFSARIAAHSFMPTLRLTPLAAAGLAAAMGGAFIRLACHRALGRHFVWTVGVHEDHSLTTDGPYAVVRHPSYTGYALMLAGPAVVFFDPRSLFAASGMGSTILGRVIAFGTVAHWVMTVSGMLRRLLREDQLLHEEFGEEWERWAERTPYRLVPYVW